MAQDQAAETGIAITADSEEAVGLKQINRLPHAERSAPEASGREGSPRRMPGQFESLRTVAAGALFAASLLSVVPVLYSLTFPKLSGGMVEAQQAPSLTEAHARPDGAAKPHLASAEPGSAWAAAQPFPVATSAEAFMEIIDDPAFAAQAFASPDCGYLPDGRQSCCPRGRHLLVSWESWFDARNPEAYGARWWASCEP
jgi:hypothetical protein